MIDQSEPVEVVSGEMPTFTIITAAYNAFDTLRETVESVLLQTVSNWELIIVDDGSTDATGDLARAFAAADARIRVLEQGNSGAAAARNAGAHVVRGSWLCMLDADDLLLPEFLEHMAAFREMHPGYDIYSPATTMLLRDGRRMPLHEGRPWDSVHSVSAVDQMWESRIAQVSLMRRDVFDRTGGYRDIYSEDYDFWLRALILGARQLSNPEALWLYRRREGSKTTALVTEAESLLSILTDAREMQELSDEQRAECDRAIVFAQARLGRRHLEEALLRGEYVGARRAYLRYRQAFPDLAKYALGLVLITASPRLYARIKIGRMI
ncbi:MAG: glycosyltransferase [Coriobacteriia bacterium]|nr:glycosyltransferase [Coriobacteriia bacterium]